MRIPRIFTDQSLAAGNEIVLEAEAARHLTQVLRLRVEDKLILFNGDGFNYDATLREAGKRSCRVEVGQPGEKDPPQPLDIELAIGISKGERMDFAIQKAVELGVTSICLLSTERSVVRLSDERLNKRIQHWRKVTVNACEQCGRAYIPRLDAYSRVDGWLKPIDSRQCLGLILDPGATETPVSLSKEFSPSRIKLFVGPEGGLSRDEMDAATASGFRSVRLGPRVLRTETAPLAAIAAIQTLWGDFRA